ncbi:MAG: alpha-glucosidase/alpha-galactosidase [Candidatus Brocadiia bacterium]
MRQIKLAFIGGGSRNWAPGMIRDLALCPDVSGQLSLYDISYSAARRTAEWGVEVFDHSEARTQFSITAHRKVRPALRGADFVVMAIQPGPIELMVQDIEIPRRYGILHTVGDTAGPAGLVRALRTVPIYTRYAEAIMEHCPAAWVMTCTNPMAHCVAALYAAAPQIRAFGYCHEVLHTQTYFAEVVREDLGVEDCRRPDIRIRACGTNHFTVATSAHYGGEDVFPLLRRRMGQPGFFDDRTEEARRWKREGKWFNMARLVAYEFLRRFGVFGAAGDRHLVEFVPWYLPDEDTLHRWGVVATPTSFRLESHAARRSDDEWAVPEHLEPSGGQCLDQVLALAGLGDLETTTNIPNRGQVPGLPLGAVLESNVRFRRDELEALSAEELPPGMLALQRRVIEVQQDTVRAARERDRDLAFQALLCDPLVGISTDRAWAMFEEMLSATKEMLPGW